MKGRGSLAGTLALAVRSLRCRAQANKGGVSQVRRRVGEEGLNDCVGQVLPSGA